jgi:hypothetical protein
VNRRTFLGCGLACLAVASCGGPPPLAHSHSSPDALAAALLDGLARRDRSALEGLALDEAEFRAHVWPELPAARPERNLPFSYVWGELNQKSRLALGETLRAHGGPRRTLRRARFSRTTPYESYVVHHDATMVVDDADGRPQEIRVCGSMIEKGGAWKVFSYVVDN